MTSRNEVVQEEAQVTVSDLPMSFKVIKMFILNICSSHILLSFFVDCLLTSGFVIYIENIKREYCAYSFNGLRRKYCIHFLYEIEHIVFEQFF